MRVLIKNLKKKKKKIYKKKKKKKKKKEVMARTRCEQTDRQMDGRTQTEGRTDRQDDSYLPPKSYLGGGGIN